MIPVDLDRLREAREAFGPIDPEDNHPVGIYLMRQLTDAVQAVLDAPTVWWCAKYRKDLPADRRTVECHVYPEHHPDCGWVNLVPVKGGQE